MSTRTRRRILIVTVVAMALAAAPFVWGVIFWGEYPTEQSAKLTFTLDDDFTTVRKILVRRDGAKQIIAMGGDSQFVDQHWENVTAGTEGEDVGEAILQLAADPQWRLDLEGNLKVRTLDPYIGEYVITLRQDVVIEPNFLDSRVNLVTGTRRLVGYKMTTRFARDQSTQSAASEPRGPLRRILDGTMNGGVTTVELSLMQEIVTKAPWFAHGVADRRVKESVEGTLTNQERAIRKFIDENKDDVPLLPLR